MSQENSRHRVYIVGAGISGLICAWELEQHGFSPTIIEKESEVGGRLQTLTIEGNKLDRGFQVLLTAYPAAKRYLDLKALNLRYFIPGAAIWKNDKFFYLADPLRQPSLLASTMAFPLATTRDKFLMLRLVLRLRFKSLKRIFQAPELGTYDYLSKQGFSTGFMQSFLIPFFSGIFLEINLDTSSKMFEFVFKMFIEGHAAVPAGGIQQIPLQLKSKLRNTTFLFNTVVSSIENRTITLQDGRALETDYVVIATDPTKILPDHLTPSSIKWQQCQNLYFKVDRVIFDKPLLGLNADGQGLINNFHFLTNNDRGRGGILSVTILKKHGLEPDQLIDQLIREISLFCPGERPRLVHAFKIEQALPVNSSLRYAPEDGDIRITDRILLAGDYVTNPSLNGAMESGKSAAVVLRNSIE